MLLKYSWEEVKISTFTGVWERLVPTPTEVLEGFRASVGAVTAEVVETAS